MARICKLVIYYFLYQFLFTALIALPSTWIQIMNNGGDVSSFTPGETTYTTTGIAMILSGIAMIWHLIHFKYLKFNLKSFGEVSGKTIGLSIPLIVAGMLFINLCSEFLGLPDLMQDTFHGMSHTDQRHVRPYRQTQTLLQSPFIFRFARRVVRRKRRKQRRIGHRIVLHDINPVENTRELPFSQTKDGIQSVCIPRIENFLCVGVADGRDTIGGFDAGFHQIDAPVVLHEIPCILR